MVFDLLNLSNRSCSLKHKNYSTVCYLCSAYAGVSADHSLCLPGSRCTRSSSKMGSALSSFFQSGSNLLPGNHRGMSEHSKHVIRTVFHALRANPRVTVQRLEGLLCQIPKVEYIFCPFQYTIYHLSILNRVKTYFWRTMRKATTCCRNVLV